MVKLLLSLLASSRFSAGVVLGVLLLGSVEVPVLARANLVRLGTAAIPDTREIACHGDWAWVGQNLGGMTLVSLRRPSRPHIVHRYSPSEVQALDLLVVKPGLLAIADRFRGLRIWDVAEPSKPLEVATVPLPGVPNHLAVYQHPEGARFVLVACGGGGIAVVDITQTRLPRLVSHYTDVDFARRLLVVGNIAYLADHFDGGLKAFDLRGAPHRLDLLLQVPVQGFCESLSRNRNVIFCGLRQYGTRAYVVGPNPADATTTPTARLLATFSRSLSRVRDVEVLPSDLLAVADDEAGLQLYDVQNPEFPVLVDEYRYRRARDGHAHSLASHKGLIYVCARNGGLQVFQVEHRAAGEP